MGVPKFYRWISERYPLINQMLSGTVILPEFDNFYLDMNGIIHACTHPNDNNIANSLSLRDMMLAIFRYVDRMVTEIVKPKKLLFMAIDGVAPRAKLNQQRARRFRAAQDRTESISKAKQRGETVDESVMFDSNCITPGTEFMDTVSRHLKYFIRKKIKEDPLWRNLTIVFSGHDVPGEGEHKIMQYIRDMRADPSYEPNQRHCMYGGDADLIMLGLATHEPHFALLREVVQFNQPRQRRSARETVMRQTQDSQFQLLHLSILREYLALDFAYGIDANIDQERVIDDFILMTFLVGNDFLPHLPTLDISEHAFDLLISCYRQLMTECPGYIVEHGQIADLKRLERLFNLIGSREHEILTNRAIQEKEFNARRRKFDANLLSEEEIEAAEAEAQQAFEAAIKEAMGVSADDALNEQDAYTATDEGEMEEEEGEALEPAGNKDHRGRFYFEKFKILSETSEGQRFLKGLMGDYLKGLMWCLAYYIKGCISWTWYFPYHYGPMLQDMKHLDVLSSNISFDLGAPFSPFQQLLGCLPPASSNLLPKCYQWIMTSKDSPIIHFYPEEFEIDQDGKKNSWEAVTLLSFIDENKLLAAEELHCPQTKLTRNEIARNAFGKILSYYFDLNSVETFLSCNPEIGLTDIYCCHSSVSEASYSLAPGHYFESALLPGTVYPIAGYPSLTILQLQGVVIDLFKINVFGSESRYKSLMMQIGSRSVDNLDQRKAELLLGRSVFVNYPQIHEAIVVAVCTDKGEYRLENATDVSRGAGKLVHFTPFDDKTAEKWRSDCQAEQLLYLKGRSFPGSGGLDIGEIQVRIKVRPLQGLERDHLTGASRKVFSAAAEADIPLQMALWRPPTPDARFVESAELPIEALMPYGAGVVAVSGSLIGCKGVIVGPHDPESLKSGKPIQSKKKVVDVEFSLPQPEPPFGHAIAQSMGEEYYSSRDICELLRISPGVLGKIVGSIHADPGRFDFGLNLKRNGMYQLLGYVRKVSHSAANGNAKRNVWEAVESVRIIGMDASNNKQAAAAETVQWEYTQTAASLICEYKARFPLLFSKLESLPHAPVYKLSELFGKEGESTANAIMEWMKAQPFFAAPRVPLETRSLSKEAMAAIERASDVHTTLNMTKGLSKHLVKGVPIEKIYCNVHQTASDVALSFNKLEPRLGDRVVNLACNGVPFGLKGTVVIIHSNTKFVEVIFDEEFIGGKSLQGACSQFRGRLCRWSDLLLVPIKTTVPTDIMESKELQLPAGTSSSASSSATAVNAQSSAKLMNFLRAPSSQATAPPAAAAPVVALTPAESAANAAEATASAIVAARELAKSRKKMPVFKDDGTDDEVNALLEALESETKLDLDQFVSNGTGLSNLLAAAGSDPAADLPSLEAETDWSADPLKEAEALAQAKKLEKQVQDLTSLKAMLSISKKEPVAAAADPVAAGTVNAQAQAQAQAPGKDATAPKATGMSYASATGAGAKVSLDKAAAERVLKHQLGLSKSHSAKERSAVVGPGSGTGSGPDAAVPVPKPPPLSAAKKITLLKKVEPSPSAVSAMDTKKQQEEAGRVEPVLPPAPPAPTSSVVGAETAEPAVAPAKKSNLNSLLANARKSLGKKVASTGTGAAESKTTAATPVSTVPATPAVSATPVSTVSATPAASASPLPVSSSVNISEILLKGKKTSAASVPFASSNSNSDTGGGKTAGASDIATKLRQAKKLPDGASAASPGATPSASVGTDSVNNRHMPHVKGDSAKGNSSRGPRPQGESKAKSPVTAAAPVTAPVTVPVAAPVTAAAPAEKKVSLLKPSRVMLSSKPTGQANK